MLTQRWKAGCLLETFELHHDTFLRVGLKVHPVLDRKAPVQTITITLRLVNSSSDSIRIASVKLENMDLLKQTVGTSLRQDKSSEYQVSIAPSLSHEIRVELDAQPLNLLVHTLRIEYSRNQNDLQLFSKAVMLLPVLPFLHMNKGLTFTADRLESIWSKVAEHWSVMISKPFELDSEFFPNLAAIVELLPTMRIGSSVSPETQASNETQQAFGLFQLTSDLAFLVKLSCSGKSTIFLQFKAPPGLSAEKMGELMAIYNHILFLLSTVQSAN